MMTAFTFLTSTSRQATARAVSRYRQDCIQQRGSQSRGRKAYRDLSFFGDRPTPVMCCQPRDPTIAFEFWTCLGDANNRMVRHIAVGHLKVE